MSRHILIPIATIVVFASSAHAQQFEPLLDARTRDLLHEALSGEVAKDHVIQITRSHRIQGRAGTGLVRNTCWSNFEAPVSPKRKDTSSRFHLMERSRTRLGNRRRVGISSGVNSVWWNRTKSASPDIQRSR